MDREPAGPAPRDRRERLIERFVGLAGEVDAVIVSDYGYGMCGAELAEAVARFRELSCAPVVLDPRTRFKSFRGVAAMTPNREDLARAVGRDADELEDKEALRRAAHMVLGSSGPGLLLVTLGKGGMALFGAGLPDEGLALPAFGSQAVVDVTGAGDTAAAAFTLGLAAGLRGPEAMVLANAAAGVVVMKLGADVCTRAELDSSLAQLPRELLPGGVLGEPLPNGVGKLGLV
jgi:D-beta-D-heptose 7-phosphate kinase/D-beta-D-heptose 1-phosphate adenosyltransferase